MCERERERERERKRARARQRERYFLHPVVAVLSISSHPHTGRLGINNTLGGWGPSMGTGVCLAHRGPMSQRLAGPLQLGALMTGCDKSSQRDRQLCLLMCSSCCDLPAHLTVVFPSSFSSSMLCLFFSSLLWKHTRKMEGSTCK